MKSFFKRSAISLLVLGATGSVYAAQFTGGFIGVEGLYLKPMNGDLDYVTTYPSSSLSGLAGSSSHFTFDNHAISTDHDWNWRIFGGIKFTDNDDITVSWMSMRTSDSSSFSANANTEDSFVLVQPRFLFPEAWQNVRGHVTFDLDDIYAVWGHTIKFNNPWTVRYAAGLEYAKLDSDLTVTANAPDGFPVFVTMQPEFTDPITDVGFKSKSEMKGIGPRVEFDLGYHFGNGFALFGNANAALLVAKREISLTQTADELVITTEIDNILQPNETILHFAGNDYSNRDVIIPKFGMRLGASYSYTFGQVGAEGMGGTTLILSGGWQVESFIHAVERPSTGYYDTEVVDPGMATANFSTDTSSTKVSNFTNQGLFLGLAVSSDWM